MRIAMWKAMLMVMAQSDYDLAVFYRKIMRTRKRYVPFMLNGRAQYVKRAVVRDYLQDYYGCAVRFPRDIA